MPEPTVRIPTICPNCLGTGFIIINPWSRVHLDHVPCTVLCARCKGMGHIGYTERPKGEIDAQEEQERKETER